MSRYRASQFKCSHANLITHYIWLSKQVMSLWTFSWINFKHTFDYFCCPVVKCVMVSVLASLNTLVEILFTHSSKRECSSQHDVQKNSKCPNINWFAFIVHFSSYFRSHIRRCATKNLQSLVLCCCEYRETKIYQFYHSCTFFYQNII